MIQIWEYYKYGESRYNSKVEEQKTKQKLKLENVESC